MEIRISDALGYLLNDERSRLGWRILLHAMPTEGDDAAILSALSTDSDLVDLVPTEYRVRALAAVAIVRAILTGEVVAERDLLLVEAWYGATTDTLLADLGSRYCSTMRTKLPRLRR